MFARKAAAACLIGRRSFVLRELSRIVERENAAHGRESNRICRRLFLRGPESTPVSLSLEEKIARPIHKRLFNALARFVEREPPSAPGACSGACEQPPRSALPGSAATSLSLKEKLAEPIPKHPYPHTHPPPHAALSPFPRPWFCFPHYDGAIRTPPRSSGRGRHAASRRPPPDRLGGLSPGRHPVWSG